MASKEESQGTTNQTGTPRRQVHKKQITNAGMKQIRSQEEQGTIKIKARDLQRESIDYYKEKLNEGVVKVIGDAVKWLTGPKGIAPKIVDPVVDFLRTKGIIGGRAARNARLGGRAAARVLPVVGAGALLYNAAANSGGGVVPPMSGDRSFDTSGGGRGLGGSSMGDRRAQRRDEMRGNYRAANAARRQRDIAIKTAMAQGGVDRKTAIAELEKDVNFNTLTSQANRFRTQHDAGAQRGYAQAVRDEDQRRKEAIAKFNYVNPNSPEGRIEARVASGEDKTPWMRDDRGRIIPGQMNSGKDSVSTQDIRDRKVKADVDAVMTKRAAEFDAETTRERENTKKAMSKPFALSSPGLDAEETDRAMKKWDEDRAKMREKLGYAKPPQQATPSPAKPQTGTSSWKPPADAVVSGTAPDGRGLYIDKDGTKHYSDGTSEKKKPRTPPSIPRT